MSDRWIKIARIALVIAAVALGAALASGQLVWASRIFYGIGALAVLIFVHEGGHFLMAKAMGLKVTEFMFGLPGPKLLHKQIGETDYGITAIPFGGYVRFVGSDPFEDVPEEDRARSFTSLSVPKKVLIMVTGPFTNIVFAFFAFVVAVQMLGTPTTRINDTLPGTPAARAGLRRGDQVVKAAGQPIATWEGLTAVIRTHGGQPLPLVLVRGSQTIAVSPAIETTAGRGFLGVEPVMEHVLYKSVVGAATTELEITRLVVGMFAPVTFVRNLPNLMGPVGIVDRAAQAAKAGVPDYVFFIGLISLAIGIFNLVPVPPLDGGRVVMVLVEGILRRPLAQKTQIAVMATGTSLLLVLMVYIVYRDITRIFF